MLVVFSPYKTGVAHTSACLAQHATQCNQPFLFFPNILLKMFVLHFKGKESQVFQTECECDSHFRSADRPVCLHQNRRADLAKQIRV